MCVNIYSFYIKLGSGYIGPWEQPMLSFKSSDVDVPGQLGLCSLAIKLKHSASGRIMILNEWLTRQETLKSFSFGVSI